MVFLKRNLFFDFIVEIFKTNYIFAKKKIEYQKIDNEKIRLKEKILNLKLDGKI